MAALVNDCDNTTLRSFERYHRFINTRSETIYGTGLGLDVSDSFFAYTAAPDYNAVMTYFSGTDPDTLKDARRIERYIRSGWIDALHAYGDFSSASSGILYDGISPENSAPEGIQRKNTSFVNSKPEGIQPENTSSENSAPEDIHSKNTPFENTQSDETPLEYVRTIFSRELATSTYGSLSTIGIFPLVWTDHGNEGNVQNFGSFGAAPSDRYKRGDDPYSPSAYHTDFTTHFGVKYIWDAKYSTQYGYDFPLSIKTLRDGRKAWSFSRYTGTSPLDWYPDRLRHELTRGRLDDLVAKGQYGLFAQHLGFYGEDYKLEQEDAAALGLLAEYQYDMNSVLTAGTARLLEYATAWKYVSYTVQKRISNSSDIRSLINSSDADGSTGSDGTVGTGSFNGSGDSGNLGSASNSNNPNSPNSPNSPYSPYSPNSTGFDINILSIDDPIFPDLRPTVDRLRGITFYCDNPENTRILINGVLVGESEMAINPPDASGRPSVSIRWFAPDYTDYTYFG